MKEIVNFLKNASEAGEIITLAYGGGSNPGASRRLIIASCSDSTFRAFDETQRVAKNFKIDKVLWAKDISGNQISNDSPVTDSVPKTPDLSTLAEYAAILRPKLIEDGWHIHESENFFGVGGYFKNGKPKKTPSIGISYFLSTTETIYDLNKDDFVEVKKEITGRERLWRVDSHRQSQGKTFGKLHSAMEFFVTEIEASDPFSAKGMYADH